MPKHKFERPVAHAGNVVIRMCSRCGKITELGKDGDIPADLQDEECEGEDFSQDAARIVREAKKE